jgi:hypothetical protein
MPDVPGNELADSLAEESHGVRCLEAVGLLPFSLGTAAAGAIQPEARARSAQKPDNVEEHDTHPFHWSGLLLCFLHFLNRLDPSKPASGDCEFRA